jgi:protein-tyrosine phosphatase
MSPRVETMTVAESQKTGTDPRVLPLAGGRNLRDLGGYPTTDGRRVKRGLLFRSGVLSGLSADEAAYLRDLGMQVICDLRTPAERAAQPTPSGITQREYRGWDYDAGDAALHAAGQAPGAKPEHVRDAMVEAYRALPWRLAPQYTAVFEHMLAGDLPLIFHCSGGKDRTGILAGLILTVLGVSRNLVFEDYALTDELLDAEKILQMREAAGLAMGPSASVAAMDPALRAPLVSTSPLYLAASLAEMENQCGSVALYLEEVLGVDEDGIEALRERMLEPG